MRYARPIAIRLLALAFACQSLLVVSAPCSPVAPEKTGHGQAGMPPYAHAGHNGSDNPMAPAGQRDCCDGGYCSLGGCFALAAVVEEGVSPGSPPRPGLVERPVPRASPDHFPDSLYRPPIYG